VPEARLEDAGSGLAPATEGWFVVNVRDAEWWSSETRGAACWFANEYGEPPVEFEQFGINVTLLEPGQSGVYHAETNQEAFLVLAGECRLLVEDEERRLRPWDFFHCPPWTEHAFVGAGDGPCAILMVGAHSGPDVRYPVSELAARYGASVEEETSDAGQVYATAERFRRDRPPYWARLPWAYLLQASFRTLAQLRVLTRVDRGAIAQRAVAPHSNGIGCPASHVGSDPRRQS
jgi:quercetin dioxygenase-like cupin family protein